jgi:hypothetical protein
VNKEDYPKTRPEAKAQGLTRFYTGKPCHKGHDVLRLVHGGGCVECRRIYQRERGRKQRQSREYKAYQREYQAKYRLTEQGAERIKAAQDKYRAKKDGEKERS